MPLVTDINTNTKRFTRPGGYEGREEGIMDRTVKEFRKSKQGYAEVVVMDVRDLFCGEYSVERLVKGGYGYEMVYSHRDLNRCLAKAQEIFNKI